MPKLTIRWRKNGKEVVSFRDERNRRVRTSGSTNWVTADQVKAVADYGIELQLAQCAAGIGSDGAPMPELKNGGTAVFVRRENGRAVFARREYAQAKVRLGLQPKRDLRGPGKDGHHLLDDVRINYLDDKRATYGITTRRGRIKALANEQKAPWWGWSPASAALLAGRAKEVYQAGLVSDLVELGIVSGVEAARVVTSAQGRRFLRRAA